MDRKYLAGPVFVWSVISGWISCAVLYALGWKLDERFFDGFQWSNIWHWASEYGIFAEFISAIIIILIYTIIFFGLIHIINEKILKFIMKRNYGYDYEDYKNNITYRKTEKEALNDHEFLTDQAAHGLLIGIFTLPAHAFLKSVVGYENIFNQIIIFISAFALIIGQIVNYFYNHYISIILTIICIVLLFILFKINRNSNRDD